MNWFGNGKKKPAEPSTVSATSTQRAEDPQKTIVKLREAIANQEKREEHLQRKIDASVDEAKTKVAKGDKKGALFALKRKKMFEQEADKIMNVKMTLETQVINLESAAQNNATFLAMQEGSKTMNRLRTEVGIDKVDEMMDDIKEEMELAQEINNAIAQPVDPLLTDDDELLEELNALETADLETELLAAPSKANKVDDLSLPTVPDAKLPSNLNAEEEDELKKLEAELAAM